MPREGEDVAVKGSRSARVVENDVPLTHNNFCMQAFGAKQYHIVGVVYQRALLIGWSYTLIITPFFLNIGRILIWAGATTPFSQRLLHNVYRLQTQQ